MSARNLSLGVDWHGIHCDGFSTGNIDAGHEGVLSRLTAGAVVVFLVTVEFGD